MSHQPPLSFSSLIAETERQLNQITPTPTTSTLHTHNTNKQTTGTIEPNNNYDATRNTTVASTITRTNLSPIRTNSRSLLTTHSRSSTTTHTTVTHNTPSTMATPYQDHQTSIQTDAHAAALRALSPNRTRGNGSGTAVRGAPASPTGNSQTTPIRLTTQPTPFTANTRGSRDTDTRGYSIVSHTTPSVRWSHTTAADVESDGPPQPSPLSPRDRARREMNRHGMRSPTQQTRQQPTTGGISHRGGFGSPIQGFDVSSSTIGAGTTQSSHMNTTSGRIGSPVPSSSPTRFREVADATRQAAANMDATLRLENLMDTPATVAPSTRPRSRISSPSRSPTRFSSILRPTPLDSSMIRPSPVPTYGSLEPWRELNRQLSLAGFGMVAPFPVATGTTADAPWSPNSERMYHGLPHQPPAVALNTLLANFTHLLTEYQRRGRQIEELMEKNFEQDKGLNQHQHCQTEFNHLRRLNSQQSTQINELHRSLEMSANERATSLANFSRQLDESAEQFKSLDLKYQQQVRESSDQIRSLENKLSQSNQQLRDQLDQSSKLETKLNQFERERMTQMDEMISLESRLNQTQREYQLKQDELTQLRTQTNELQIHYDRQLREEHDHTQQVLSSKEVELTTSQVRVRELERNLQECQIALLTTQTTKQEMSEQFVKKEQDYAYLNNVLKLESDEKIRNLTLVHETERLASLQRLREVESDCDRKLRQVESDLQLSQLQNIELTKLSELVKNDLATTQTKSQVQDETINMLSNERNIQGELIRELEAKIVGLQEAAVGGYNSQELIKYLNSFQTSQLLTSRQQLSNSFDVARVSDLPKDVLVEAILVACIKLKLSDATQIGSALDQVISVASAVPGMQDFIQQIWKVVNGVDDNSHVEALTPENLVALTTTIIPTLKHWSFASQHTAGLQRFKLEIIDALRRRVHRSPLNPLHSTSGASSSSTSSIKLHDDLPMDEIVFEVNDIVSNENRLNSLVYDQHSSPSSFFQLWAQMDKTPLVSQPYSQESDKIISHMQQLFDVPHRIGLFPKMNELFLFVNETRPAIQAMRSLLKLDSRATIHTCIKALKRLVEGVQLSGGMDSSFHQGGSVNGSQLMTSPIRQEGNGRGLAWTVTSPSKHEVSFLNPTDVTVGSSGTSSSAPTNAQIQRNAQYWTICKQLKSTLRCKKVTDIPHCVEELLAKSQPNDFLTQSILTQLVTMLEVNNITELPTAVSWLKSRQQDLQRELDQALQHPPSSSSQLSQELSNQLLVKRDEFIQHLKDILGIGAASDSGLVDELIQLHANKDHQQMSQQAQKDQQLILTQLRGYLDLASSDAIVPTVRTLLKQNESFHAIYPQLDSMVSQLYALLNVDKLDEIVPSVRRAVIGLDNSSSGINRVNTQPTNRVGPFSSTATSLTPATTRTTPTTPGAYRSVASPYTHTTTHPLPTVPPTSASSTTRPSRISSTTVSSTSYESHRSGVSLDHDLDAAIDRTLEDQARRR